jgi:gliding motility-associated-like protein
VKNTSTLFSFFGLALFLFLSQFSFGQPTNFQNKQPGFIENKGQMRDQNNKPNSSVKFLLALPEGMNMQLKSNGFSYDTYSIDDTTDKNSKSGLKGVASRFKKKKPLKFRFHRVDINFIGANPSPQIIAEAPSLFCYHYINKASSPVRSFGKVTYKNIYPFIDLIFERKISDSGKIIAEYYFEARPGGNPNIIQWRYSGAFKTDMVGNRIVITVSKGKFQEHIPKSYLFSAFQNSKKGSAIAKDISVRYRQITKDEYGFRLPAFDHSQTLIIDPTPDLIWGTYYGGYLNDWGYAIAKDQGGNIIVGGSSDNAIGIATIGAYQTTLDGYSDAILGKFTSDGALIWMTYYGGNMEDDIEAVAVDQDNNIVVSGITQSSDGIATPGALMPTKISPSNYDAAFVAKFSDDGEIYWGSYYGGELEEQCYAVAIDLDNNIILTGGTVSTTGISTPGAYQINYAGGAYGQQYILHDVFLAKLYPDGARAWGTYYGGVNDETTYGVAIDKQNNIVITGTTGSPASIATPASFQSTIGATAQGSNSFISKFSTSGSLIWGTYYGTGGNSGAGFCITTDNNNNIYVGGNTTYTANISTPGAMQPAIGDINNYGDGYLVKFNTNGARQWGTYCGSSGTDYVYGIISDGVDGIWITGDIAAQCAVITPNAYQTQYLSSGNPNVFVAKFNSSGNRQWGTYYGKGGDWQGQGEAIATDGNGNVYVTGETLSSDNIATCGAVQTLWGGNQDMFVAKFGENAEAAIPSITISNEDSGTICEGATVSFTAVSQNVQNSYTYEWLLNGSPVGTDTSLFSSSGLVDGDSVRCLLELSSQCNIGNYGSNSIIIHIDPGLIPSVTISSPTDTICQGDGLKFTATEVNGGSDSVYQWLQNGIDVGSDSSTFVTNNLATGDNITCMLTRRHACTIDSIANSNSIVIYVRPIPQPSISINTSDDTICSGLPVNFKATVTGAPSPSYQWKINGNDVGSDSSGLTTSGLDSGDQVECILTATGSVCSVPSDQSNIITEIIYPTPTITIIGDTIITKGSTTQLSAQVFGNTASYKWTPDSTLSNGSVSNPIASPQSTTIYTLNVNSDQGCISQKQVTVTVIAKISIPNAFTPNGDGKNENFQALYGSDVFSVHFRVFNRWGQLVFEDNGSHKTWDGKFGGIPQSAGTYAWVFEYKDISGMSNVLKGTVELIR